MRDNFRTAIRVARQGNRNLPIQAVNGCCYGTPNTDRGDYRKICGAAFWEFISGDANMFTKLIPMLQEASANGYDDAVGKLTTRIADELTQNWCDNNGQLNWPRIATMNSAAAPTDAAPTHRRPTQHQARRPTGATDLPG